MGCEHYSRECHVRAECCQEWVACRLCHNAQFTDHEIDRHAIRVMRCDACQTVQPCAQTCSQCHTTMAAYFCQVCNLFDNNGETKQIFHCDGCGICRVGGRENFFHCDKCCGCYPHSLQAKHKCLEGSMHRECAICLEVTFASLESVHVLPCGHVLHGGCWEEYIRHGHYRCPSCRTRMFWSDDAAGDDVDDDSGDDDENDEEDDDEDESDDDEDDEGESDDDEEDDDEDESEESQADSGETVENDTVSSSPNASIDASSSVSEVSVPAAAAADASTMPPPAPAAVSTESGVAQELVNAIIQSLTTPGDSASEHADTTPAQAPQ